MRRPSVRLRVVLIRWSSLLRSECIPLDQAKQQVGETRCVTGRVLRIEQSMRGVLYLDFREDYRLCRFTAVIFPSERYVRPNLV
jgi:hypothetical protein